MQWRRLCCVWLALVYVPCSLHAFSSLAELERYAQSVPEAAPSDNNDWVDPEFYTAYAEIAPGIISRFAASLGIYTPTWDIAHLEKRLSQVTRQRAKPDKDGVHELELPQGAHVVVFGDMHGAFHSAARLLGVLRDKGIINSSLRIVEKDAYIVIVGDAVSRSPYSLQTLTLILDLMYYNPENVIYLRGNHESERYWENFSMRRALKYFAGSYAGSKGDVVPLREEINTFFSTLPRACIWNPVSDTQECVYVGHERSGGENVIRGKRVQAELVGERRREVLGATKGLDFIGFAHGYSGWSLLSCPVHAYRTFFNFHYDSCVIAHVARTVNETAIEHVHRHVDKEDSFHSAWYDIMLGIKRGHGGDDKKQKPRIAFGSTVYLSGRLASLGQGIQEGIEKAAMHNNTDAMSHAYLRPLVFDDRYVPRLAYQNIQQLRESFGVNLVVIPTGSPTLASYFNDFPDLAVFFPLTGAPQFRAPEVKNVVHFRASYLDETRALLKYMFEEYGIRRCAFFYQEDAYGEPPLEEAHAYLQERGVTEWLDIPYTREQTDFEHASREVAAFNPEALVCFSTSTPTQELVTQTGVDFFLGKPLFGISGLDDEAFHLFQRSRGIHAVLSYVVPDPQKSDYPLVQEYRTAMDEEGIAYGSNSLEAYIATSLFHEALRSVKPPYTPRKLLAFYEGLRNYPFGGFTLTFDPQTRSFLQPVWINDQGEWKRIADTHENGRTGAGRLKS